MQMNLEKLEEFIQSKKVEAKQLWEKRANINNYHITGSWLRGFIEADGSFINDNTNNSPLFEISQHFSDSFLLNAIKAFFQCGYTRLEDRISKETNKPVKMCVYRMSLREDIEKKLLPLLNKGFLFPNKKKSYEQWLYRHFPTFKAPIFTMESSFDINWLIGFTDGDGSFYFRIDATPPKLVNRKLINQSKTGFQVRCVFDLAQKDSESSFCDLGNILFPHSNKKIFETYTNRGDNVSHLRITSFKLLNLYVKPIFSNQSLQSRKYLDWFLWDIGLFLMENKYHLFEKGLNAYREFQDLMEFYRITPPPSSSN